MEKVQMKVTTVLTALAVACCASTAAAVDLTLTIQLLDGPGGSPIACGAEYQQGDTVYFEIVGELSADANQGLALFGFDMEALGPNTPTDDLDLSTQAIISAGTNMGNFVDPLGLNNPAGFGGTASGDDLLQIGGGENTILDSATNGIPPDGTVDLNLALNGSPEVLAEGSISIPGGAALGTYTLQLPSSYASGNGFANVITDTATGVPFWEVEAVVTVSAGVCTFDVAVPGDPPVITGTASLVTHTVVGEMGIGLGDSTEPRDGGVAKMEITFDIAMDETTAEDPANISIQDETLAEYSGTITTQDLSLDGLVLTVGLSAGLPDMHCYTVNLSGMESTQGVDIADGDPTFVFGGLEGDANDNDEVDPLDFAYISLRLGQPVVDADTARADVNLNGEVDPLDFSFVSLRLGRSVASCMP
jgi:hypothetical protein